MLGARKNKERQLPAPESENLSKAAACPWARRRAAELGQHVLHLVGNWSAGQSMAQCNNIRPCTRSPDNQLLLQKMCFSADALQYQVAALAPTSAAQNAADEVATRILNLVATAVRPLYYIHVRVYV